MLAGFQREALFVVLVLTFGAPQTGTHGFFHDRTINLDGKANLAAPRAILDKGDVLEYARNST